MCEPELKYYVSYAIKVVNGSCKINTSICLLYWRTVCGHWTSILAFASLEYRRIFSVSSLATKELINVTALFSFQRTSAQWFLSHTASTKCPRGFFFMVFSVGKTFSTPRRRLPRIVPKAKTP